MERSMTKMTYEQYCLLPGDRNQYELFDGDLRLTRTFSSGEVVESPLFPAVALSVASVF